MRTKAVIILLIFKESLADSADQNFISERKRKAGDQRPQANTRQNERSKGEEPDPESRSAANAGRY